MNLIDQPAIDLAEARRRLGELRSRALARGAIGLALALLGALLCVLGADEVGIPFLIGAGAAALLVALARDDRARLLVRLVAQDDAWSIDEVRRAGTDLVSAGQRRRLASWLEQAAEAAGPRQAEFNFVDPFRAASADHRLRQLAAAVGDLAAPLRPPAAALCRRLLSDAVVSPLYNPNLADAELDRVLDRIERAV